MTLGIGMCVSQTRAVIEGLFQKTGEFVRTPKRGDRAPRHQGRRYQAVLRGLPGIELLLAGWFAWAVAEALERGLWGALPFLMLFLTGFLWVGILSLTDWTRGFARSTGA